jgi:thiaminase
MPPKRAAPGGVLSGNVANPHLSAGRRAPHPPIRPRPSYGAPNTPHHAMPPPGPPKPTPSLANHLLGRDPEAVKSATEQAFLSHAGCGTISANALTHWLAQDAHVSRAFVSFVGRLIGKIRLPDTAITMENTTFRTFDLLISTLNNVRREMSFFDTTASKWGLQIEPEIPKPSTKGFIDLLSSASSSSASLLEGLVLLWATEHVSVDASLQFETNAIDVIISVTALRGITQAHSPTTTRPAQITRYPHT